MLKYFDFSSCCGYLAFRASSTVHLLLGSSPRVNTPAMHHLITAIIIPAQMFNDQNRKFMMFAPGAISIVIYCFSNDAEGTYPKDIFINCGATGRTTDNVHLIKLTVRSRIWIIKKQDGRANNCAVCLSPELWHYRPPIFIKPRQGRRRRRRWNPGVFLQ